MQSKKSIRASECPATTVSVLIATYNRREMIAATLQSLQHQTRPADEIVIINDGSTDNTLELLSNVASNVKVINKANGGKPAALNDALRIVDSDYIWVFDDDDYAFPDALDTHLKFLAANPEFDFSFSRNHVFGSDEEIKNLTARAPAAVEVPCANSYLDWLLNAFFLPTLMQGMLIPTRCYKAVGGFDPALTRSEDLDFLLRLARRYRGGFINKSTWAFRSHLGDRGSAKDRHSGASRETVFRSLRPYIFGKVRESLELCEYLPHDPHNFQSLPLLTSLEERDALLRRAVIMARHGLADEAIADFDLFRLKVAVSESEITRVELTQISKLAHIHAELMQLSSAFYVEFGSRSYDSKDIFRAQLRGVFWSVRREFRARRFLRASKYSMSAVYLSFGALSARLKY